MEMQRLQKEGEEEDYEWMKVAAWSMAEEARVCGGGGRREVAVKDRSLKALARKDLVEWKQFGGDGKGNAKTKKKNAKAKKRTRAKEQVKKERQRSKWSEAKKQEHAEKQKAYRARKKEAKTRAAKEEAKG